MSHATEMKAEYQVGRVRVIPLLHMFPKYCKSTVYFYATSM